MLRVSETKDYVQIILKEVSLCHSLYRNYDLVVRNNLHVSVIDQ
jgi:hypothetical protein